MITTTGLVAILSVSILLQLAAAAIALCMIRRSGVYMPWVFIASAITLMSVRRIISFAHLLEGDLAVMRPVLPEITALLISILMLGGLVFFRPAFTSIRRREDAAHAVAREQALLARESHHHIKNALQLLQSLVSLQEGMERDEGRVRFLVELGTRIRTIGVMHDQLYEVDGSEAFSVYADALVRGIRQSYEGAVPSLRLCIEVDLIDRLGFRRSQIVHLGIIMSEAVTNAFKYAFHGLEDPTIQIRARRTEGAVALEIMDNGRGFPEPMPEESFGMMLMRTIARSEGWGFEARSEDGTTIRVTLQQPDQ